MTIPINNTTTVPQTQIPQTAGADGDAAIQGDGTGKVEAGDAPIIQGAGLVVSETDATGRKDPVNRTDSSKKPVDVNEVPELDAEEVRDLVAIIGDLEKLVAELKNTSTEKQIESTKERIASLKSKLQLQYTERMAKIDDSLNKMDEAARLKQAQEASAWMNIGLAILGAVIAIAAAVVAIATAGAGIGIFVAVVACVGALAASASAGLQIYQQVAKDDLEQQVKDKAEKYRDQGLSDSEALKKATEDVTGPFLTASLVLAGISIVCGFAGSVGSAAGSALRIITAIQAVASGFSMAGGTASVIITDKANDANYDAQSTQAELTRLEGVLQKLKKQLDENNDEIKKLIEQLMDAMSQLSKLLESAAETTDEISEKTGASA
jgi:hypothetical protein